MLGSSDSKTLPMPKLKYTLIWDFNSAGWYLIDGLQFMIPVLLILHLYLKLIESKDDTYVLCFATKLGGGPETNALVLYIA